MKRFIIAILALILIFSMACKKDDISPSKPKQFNLDCRGCEGGWDLTDIIP